MYCRIEYIFATQSELTRNTIASFGDAVGAESTPCTVDAASAAKGTL